ncbi:MAG TPA: GGDEF domain-containing protein [Nitrospirae bacterium]|nr:GGDEF domain-containing protein [Nitrospirota bacterium]
MENLKTEGLNPTRLPSPPVIAIRVLEAVKKDDFSFKELSEIIASDPALTAKILSIVNSSFYALPYKVDSLEKAVSILGVDALKNIALSFMIISHMMSDNNELFDFNFFWKRSLTAAVASEIISKHIGGKTDDIFVTALLMDIGIIVMYLVDPLKYQQVLDQKRFTGMDVVGAEKKVLGYDHQKTGSEVLKKWGLPESIFLPIACHHNTVPCPGELKDTVKILRISDMASSFYHSSRGIDKLDKLRSFLKDEFGLEEGFANSYIDSVAEKTVEILSSYNLDPGNFKPYSELLMDANEELGRVNLSYEQLIIKLKQEKKRAEKFASELQTANEKLRELAFRDGLTGLYNHLYFQELMEREMERASRYGHPLSLIMIDIDHFKKINDTYGHPQGDIVLKKIAAVISLTLRSSDIAARYGGEEFSIVLPETALKGAAVLAERIRLAVEKLKIPLNCKQITQTVSLGVTTYDPEKRKVKKGIIIDAADKALYSSKKNGRNRVSIFGLQP